jgi:hypothetical protein
MIVYYFKNLRVFKFHKGLTDSLFFEPVCNLFKDRCFADLPCSGNNGVLLPFQVGKDRRVTRAHYELRSLTSSRRSFDEFRRSFE